MGRVASTNKETLSSFLFCFVRLASGALEGKMPISNKAPLAEIFGCREERRGEVPPKKKSRIGEKSIPQDMFLQLLDDSLRAIPMPK